jgi:hypothetical protein
VSLNSSRSDRLRGRIGSDQKRAAAISHVRGRHRGLLDPGDPPARLLDQRQVLSSRQDRLPRLGVTGAASQVRRGHHLRRILPVRVRRDADGQHAPGCGAGGQPGEQPVSGIPFQVDEQSLADEQARLIRVMTREIEHRAHIIGAEIDRGQDGVSQGAYLPQQPGLVILSCRMV